MLFMISIKLVQNPPDGVATIVSVVFVGKMLSQMRRG